MGFSDLVHKVLGTADKLLVQDLPHDTREVAALAEDAAKVLVQLDPELEAIFQGVGDAGNAVEGWLTELGTRLGELKAAVATRPVPQPAPAPVGEPSEPPATEPVEPEPAGEPATMAEPPDTEAAAPPMEVEQAEAPAAAETAPAPDPDPVPDAADAVPPEAAPAPEASPPPPPPA